ncbi:MAG: type II toxin-antitoxin system RelE/ParE family toxin [Leptospirales bacterium]
MSKPTRFKPKAEKDFESILNWYSEINSLVADKFCTEIDESLSIISQNPRIGASYKFKIRKYVLKNFPYIIFYVAETHEIIILAIFHGLRNPEQMERDLK